MEWWTTECSLAFQRKFHNSGAGIWVLRNRFLCDHTALTRHRLRRGRAAPFRRFSQCFWKARLDHADGLCYFPSANKKVSPLFARLPRTQRSSSSAWPAPQQRFVPKDASRRDGKQTVPSNSKQRKKLLWGTQHPFTAPQRCLVRVLNPVSYTRWFLAATLN